MSATLPAIASASGQGEMPHCGRWRLGRVRLGRLMVLGLGLAAPAALAAPLPPAAPAPPAPGAAAPARPAAIVSPAPLPASAPGVVPPLSEAAFTARLARDDLAGLDDLCSRSVAEDDAPRLRRLRERLLTLHPAPQPLPVLLANADVLLTCRAPQAALQVLDRYGPGPGAERVQWLLLQWRAASAGLDHRRAALALERLSASDPVVLQSLLLPIRRRDDGTMVSREAVELLADHLESRGLRQAAAELLLASRQAGAAGAERLQRAVRLFEALPAAEQDAVLETALEQAAAAGAWSLVTEILDEQTDLDPPSARAIERRLRLSGRLDDAYGEWRLRRRDPAAAARTRQLERQLRSPRAPAGHAAEPAAAPPPSPLPPSP
ncbi:MAG: hypothetical protein ACKOZW_07050 [Cyanobium sp.]